MTDSELLSPHKPLPPGARPSIFTGTTISELAEAVSRNLPETACYLYREQPVIIRQKTELDKIGRTIKEPEVLTLTPDNFATWVEQHMRFHKAVTNEGQYVTESLGTPKIKQILASFIFRDRLSKVREISAVRLPIRVYNAQTKTTSIELASPGLDPRSGIYTLDLLPYQQDRELTREEQHRKLQDLLGEFPWADITDGSRTFATSRNIACYMAYMVGQFCRHLIDQQPIILFNANQPGSGKTLLACLGLGPVEGAPTVTGYPDNPDELRKTIFAKANSGASYVMLDDIPNLKSKHINQVATADKMSDRRMHSQEELVVRNKLQLIGTGNRLDTSADIARRALIIDLFAARKIAEAKHTQHLDQQFLNDEDWRRDMLALLWQWVRDWQRDGCPAHCTPDDMKSFGGFASIAGSIVVHAGFSNPFERRQGHGMGGDSKSDLQEELIIAAANLRYTDGYNWEPWQNTHAHKLLAFAAHPTTLPMVYEYSVPELLKIAIEDLGTADALTWGVKEDQRARSLGSSLSQLKGRIYVDAFGREFEFGRVKRTSTTKYTFTWLKNEIPADLVANAKQQLQTTPNHSEQHSEASTPFDY